MSKIQKMMPGSWDCISGYVFDKPGVEFNFSAKVMSETGWSRQFTARVIEEYRRFMWMAVNAGIMVVPSDEVDQVWHVHVLYTREYFETWCPEFLGKIIHHGPSLGGVTEEAKHEKSYAKTLEVYRHHFGMEPVDIWPDAQRRFHSAYLRTCLNDTVVLPRNFIGRVAEVVNKLIQKIVWY